MNILILGSGGREHALTWKLAQSPQVTSIWVAPGNAGTSLEKCHASGALAQNVPIGAEDLPRLLEFAREKRPDLIVVGPDNPLAMGVVDLFQKEGFRIWGPNQKAAQFESSKIFAQQFMDRHGIPTARARSFSEPGPARDFAKSLGRCAIKADGLALGKGVIVCSEIGQAEEAIREMMVKRVFGAAGDRILIQEFLEGPEVSLHALCDGNSYQLFPTSQDHKRALDDDQGLNTGGMGTYSPAPYLSESQLQDVRRAILDPWLAGCLKEGIDYRGILYPGLILTKEGPKVLEFNARFGDPETQVYLARLQSDLLELLDASVSGNLGKHRLNWNAKPAVCVIMASAGYPGNYPKGKPISGLTEAEQTANTKVFHAGTSRSGDQIVTSGGRVLGVTSLGEDLRQARTLAYEAVERIHFEGAQYRRDIAAKGLKNFI